ncbi:hypothetical protein BB558_003234 [Smittium angustum]|uniref:Uncharacterized protein n=1 Tax=Smittium angustum TaxID=133377 RepID=A0A2U1J6K6_SMIAN|nr:hypothetical protein BB558_003234 [Smittium angustum]
MLSKVPTIQLGNKNLPVQGSTVRTKLKSSGFYKACLNDLLILGKKRKKSEEPQYVNKKVKQPRILDQEKQIISHSKAANRKPSIYNKLAENEFESSQPESQGYQKRGYKADTGKEMFNQKISGNYWEVASNINSSSPKKNHDEMNYRAKKFSAFVNKELGNYNKNIRTSTREFKLVEELVHPLVWQELSTRDAGIGNIYRCKQQKIWNNICAEKHYKEMEKGRDGFTNQCKENANNIPGFKTQENTGMVCVDLLIKQRFNSSHQKIWRNEITEAAQDGLHIISAQSSRCPIQISSPIRMEDSQIYIQQDPEEIWSALRTSKQQKFNRLVIPGTYEKIFMLPALELNTESNTKDEKRKGNNNVDSTPLEIRNMVSGSSGDGNTATNTDTIIKSTTRKQKQKFGSEQKQKLDAISMENKRIRLSQQGLDSSAIHFVLNNNHQNGKQKNYSSIQNRFISCKKKRKIGQQEQFTAIKQEGLKSFDNPEYNLKPIMDKFKLWRNNEEMKIINLTSKLCFLLGFCGFMRSSEIERIDESRTKIKKSLLGL